MQPHKAEKNRIKNRLPQWEYLAFIAAVLLTFVLCVSVGTVRLPWSDVIHYFTDLLFGTDYEYAVSSAPQIMTVRVPRVICVALSGMSLALCGCAMQGLLKNPLAEGSTLGVSSGAALGAIIAIAFDIHVPFLSLAGPTVMAMLFAFGSIMLILFLAYRLDYSLSTNTIVLLGVIYSLFVSSIIMFITTFSSEKIRSITYWTMGSLQGSSYTEALILFTVLAVCASVILSKSEELNAFAIGEDNARSIGIDVRKTRLTILISVSALIGTCVSIGGSIGFVRLVVPHMTRMIVGPNHRRLLPATLFSGAVFLMLMDLIARVILKPRELPIGAVTSLIGAVLFVFIFAGTRRTHR
ncbi:MAG: iron ABC transporter permease [Oscillospiraceae bacterium]|nr:iron ABC transporter permease [Oscillospiraceae bacterium]